VGRKCKERTPGERSGLEAGQENGYGQICMEIPRVNLDTGRLKRTTKQASKQARFSHTIWGQRNRHGKANYVYFCTLFATQIGNSQEKEQTEKEHVSLWKVKNSIISLMAKFTERHSYGFQKFSKEMQYNNRAQYFLSDHLQFLISSPFTPT
jgi:hypothetical protein